MKKDREWMLILNSVQQGKVVPRKVLPDIYETDMRKKLVLVSLFKCIF